MTMLDKDGKKIKTEPEKPAPPPEPKPLLGKKKADNDS